MAYASAASLLHTIDLLLKYHRQSISPRFTDQIISIHGHTSFLLSFLESSSDRVNNWEETIRQASNKAEDIIELLLSDSLLESSTGSSEKDRKYEVRYGLDELEKAREEIESIATRVKGGKRIKTPVGSDDELMEIVSRLRAGLSSLEMIAICGSGGIGKTTLAEKAYHHSSIRKHFVVRTATGFTRQYTWLRVIRSLLANMKVTFPRSDSEDQLIQRLLHKLGDTRYLIWADDVWSRDVLEKLTMMLPDHGNGSRIIFTTRSSDLAKSAHHIHEMRLLDDDQTWDLLLENIFEGDPCPFQLESLGKTIARSCGGHRLSIEVISGVLASNQTDSAWEDVSENIKTLASQVDKILYLSYVYLPNHLRPCLLYFGLFPEGNNLSVSRLVELWIAEGFVIGSESKSLEETGEEYVEDLVRRRLAYVDSSRSNGRIKRIRVHDLSRGMCLRQADIDNFNLQLDRDTPMMEEAKEIIRPWRRVSTFAYCDDSLSGVYGSTIRTLFFHTEHVDLRCWMGNVRLLRILSLLNGRTHQLSEPKPFHLRYLFSQYNSDIPGAFSNLENLQTLIIFHEKIGGVFDMLLEGIWGMPQLRHIRVISFKFPYQKSPASVALKSLQTLSRVVDFVCSSENLKTIPNLKKLSLLYTENSRNVVEDYELHNLKYLKLESLKIQTNVSFEEEHKMRCATFPQTLKKLSLRGGLQLSWEDMKIVGSLPNLEVLKLRKLACVGETWETSEGGFSRLVFLLLEDSNLKNWTTQSSHFPRLCQLFLVRCTSLLEIPFEMAEIPTLKKICLDELSHSLLRSAQRIRKDRRSFGHDPLHIYLV